MNENDWLVYMDLDVIVNYETMTKWINQEQPPGSRFLPSFLRGIVGEECDFVAQDANHTINTGFLAFRKAKGGGGEEIVDKWVSERQRMGVRNDGYVDQLPLQSAVLKLLSPNGYHNECDRKREQQKNPAPTKVVYGFETENNVRDGKQMNACFRDTMESYGHGHHKRTFGSRCFIDPDVARINMKENVEEWLKPDLFYHGRQLSIAQEVYSTWPKDTPWV